MRGDLREAASIRGTAGFQWPAKLGHVYHEEKRATGVSYPDLHTDYARAIFARNPTTGRA